MVPNNMDPPTQPSQVLAIGGGGSLMPLMHVNCLKNDREHLRCMDIEPLVNARLFSVLIGIFGVNDQ